MMALVTADTNWKWWGMAGTVLAAGLAYGLYSRAPHESADRTINRTGSIRQMEPGYQQVDAEQTADTAVVTNPSDEQEGISSQFEAAPVHQPIADSSVSKSTLTDSIAVMPTDTAQ
jgi:hypothetical protein